MSQNEIIEIIIPYELEEVSRNQILYSAAFIVPGIINVINEKGFIKFLVDRPIDKEIFITGLKTLSDRFSIMNEFKSDIIFKKPFTGKGNGHKEIQSLISSKKMQEVHQGLFVWREPISKLLDFLDFIVVKRFARPFNARLEKHPNVIAIESLAKTNHLTSFPEHLHFIAHLKPELDNIDRYSDKIKAEGMDETLKNINTSPPEIVQNPSTCYNCFASLKNSKINDNIAITAKSSCHRYESSNHVQLGRLLEFDLREVIFIGSPEYVRSTRERTLLLIQDFVTDWELGGSLQSENDPFFTSDFKIKAKHQREMKMKYEYRSFTNRGKDNMSIMSSNLHGLTFSKAFNIKSDNGPVHTGCLGFGIERFAISFIAQHSLDIRNWPKKIRSDWNEWMSVNDL
tara:strand:+ start:4604 stop:5800 length:1197 start_codon:yes stop_codon:yes gene_type:complete